MINHVRETMQSSRDYVSCAQYQEVTNALKQLKHSQFENLNDIYSAAQIYPNQNIRVSPIRVYAYAYTRIRVYAVYARMPY